MSAEKPGKHQWVPVIAAIITASAVVAAAYISADAKRQVEALKAENESLKGEVVAIQQELTLLTGEVLNGLFGEDNWFVFPDHRDGVGVERLREQFQVTPPVLYIDFAEARYKRGETVPGGGAATAKLTGPLGKGVFPAWQHEALLQWEKSRNETRTKWFKAPDYKYVDPRMLDGFFGEASWKCDKSYDFAIVVPSANSFDVQYPFTAVDGPDIRKYGVGRTVPAGQSRVWVAGRLEPVDCPS